MKKTIAFFLIFLWHLSYSQEVKQPPVFGKNIIKANILSPFANSLSFGYERNINPKHSLQISGYVGEMNLGQSNYFKFKGLCLDFRVYTRVYSGKQTEGMFWGPYLRYLNGDLRDFIFNGTYLVDSYGNFILQEKRVSVIKPGLMIGAREFFFSRLSIDVFAGIHYQFSSENLKAEDLAIKLMVNRGISFRTGINAGFLF